MSTSTNDREQILVILSRFPYPLVKGDKLRAYYQLKELSKNFDIILFCVSDETVSNQGRLKVSEHCKELIIHRLTWYSKLLNMSLALISGKPLQTGYFFSFRAKKLLKHIVKVNNINHIYCQLVRVSEYVKNTHHISKTLDYMDALSSGVRKRISNQPFYLKWLFRIEANRLTKYERHIFDYFENHTIISDQDKLLISHPDNSRIVTVPNGVNPSFLENIQRHEKYEFVFVGNMSYPPNIEAVDYIDKYILSELPGSTLLISGANPNNRVKKIAANNGRITLQGWTEDIREAYISGKIFIAPMLIGTGMQNKLLEAMALGTPCITTSLANNALAAKNGEEILVGNTAEELLECCKLLLSDQRERERIANAAKALILGSYSWEKSTSPLLNLIHKK